MTPTSENDTTEFLSTVDNKESKANTSYRIYKLADLTPQQISAFVTGSGLSDSRPFLEEVERTDARMFTTRPQDLEELLQFWNTNNRIGSHSEIIEASIARRLEERDQNRRVSQPVSPERVRHGARLLAAATTLCRVQTVQVPDGNYGSDGIRADELFRDWNAPEVSALLARPVFDEAIYGAVRFHHRSVREYLAAEWFHELIKKRTSRRNIESLFFRDQYGTEVIVPALRPILCWLTGLDEGIRNKAFRIEPSVLFEGGDPTLLPHDIRQTVLREVCAQLNSGSGQQFSRLFAMTYCIANKDLIPDIRELLCRFKHDEYVTIFLLQVIWRGRILDLRPEVLEIALSADEGAHTRINAFKALKTISQPQGLEKVRQQLLSEGTAIDRDLIAELIKGLPATEPNANWLLQCLVKSASKERFTADSLDNEIETFVRASDAIVLQVIVDGIGSALQIVPFEVRAEDASPEQLLWLLGPASKAIERLIEERAENALKVECLSVLQEIFSAEHRQIPYLPDLKTRLSAVVPAWPELNRALFWYVVRQSRLDTKSDVRNRLIRLGRIAGSYVFQSYWRFGDCDFDSMLTEIQGREALDEQRVALSVAFQIYVAAGRQRKWREQLKNTVAGNAALVDQLSTLFRPPRQREEEREFKRQEANWRKTVAAQEAREGAIHRDWKRWLAEHLDDARKAQTVEPSTPTNSLAYLFQVLRSSKSDSSRWAQYNWKDLVPEYGEDVARFYRDSMVGFWRNFTPELRSEGAPFNKTPYSVVYGLTGLEIEATESDDWPNDLTESEVERACRYASHELNGFPTWFPKLFEAYPDAVIDFLMQELEFEFSVETAGERPHYIIDDISSSGQWAWDQIGPHIYTVLGNSEPKNLWNLNALLKILNGSSISDEMLSELAANKCHSITDDAHLTCWFAVWVGVAPQDAIPALGRQIDQFPMCDGQISFAVDFILELMGGGGRSANVRNRFLTVDYLKRLYLLMSEHIRHEDDECHARNKPYSPGLRDDAESARNRLLNVLIEIPGKESFLALREISNLLTCGALRPRMLQLAKEKAESDADLVAWSVPQVRQFNADMERTPRDHRELAELAKLRLLDLKDDLENGDNSLAGVLKSCKETQVRNFIGGQLRDKACGRYSISQEEELADAKKPDLRFVGVGIDNPVPVEIKLARKWSGTVLLESLENQLCGNYLRDNRSGRGFFIVVSSPQFLVQGL